ncbi:MAG TPA: RNA polymerase sigma factor [Humisphaera sp.]|nr:RNA polymerase sigma factor [Humisphaera sp.]
MSILERTNSKPATDEDLARRAQAGCRASFEQLVRRYQVSLLRFINERVHCEADAQDLVQDTFVRAYQRIDRYRDAWRFSTWLFTIGHRLAISHLRSRRVRKAAQAEEIASLPDRKNDRPGQLMMEDEGRKRFWDAAAAVLTDEQMAAVWLYYVEGLSAPDVAKVLGRSWVSVKTMLFRARRRLAPALEYAISDRGSASGLGMLAPMAVTAG